MKHLDSFDKKILFLGLLVHLIAAYFSVGYHHPDEHFQIIEFANYKLGKTAYEFLPWEYAAAIRPGLQPFLAWLLLKPYYALGFTNPYHFTFILRLISGLLALLTAWQFHKSIAPQIKKEFYQKLHLVLSILGWGLVYLHVRFSSENWSAMAMAWAIMLLWQHKKYSYLLAGALMGFSFVFRFHAIFMIGGAGLFLFFIEKINWRKIVSIKLGFIAAFAVGLLCEYWLYGRWTVSAYGYVYENIVANKAAQFGTEPWYWYFGQILNLTIPPFSLVLLFAIPVMLIYRPRHILTWCLIPFLLGHIVVGHKEFRFLYPLAFFIPFYAVSTLQFAEEKLNFLNEQKIYQFLKQLFRKGFWTINIFALLLIILKPASDLVFTMQAIQPLIKKPTIMIHEGILGPTIECNKQGKVFYDNPLLSIYSDSAVKANPELINTTQNILLLGNAAFTKDELMFQNNATIDSNDYQIVWQYMPKIAFYININHWIERSNTYTLYERKKQ